MMSQSTPAVELRCTSGQERHVHALIERAPVPEESSRAAGAPCEIDRTIGPYKRRAVIPKDHRPDAPDLTCLRQQAAEEGRPI